MVELIPWIIVMALAVLLILLWGAFRSTTLRSLKMAEFIAISFIQPKTYENHRSEFLSWIDRSGLAGNDYHSAVQANAAAEQLVMSYYEKLNSAPPAPLMAVLMEFKNNSPSEPFQVKTFKSKGRSRRGAG